jgi:hypothetical protein
MNCTLQAPPHLYINLNELNPSGGPTPVHLLYTSGATTPVRKISAHEFEKGGLVKPIVTTIDGTPTFLSPSPHDHHLTLMHKVGLLAFLH